MAKANTQFETMAREAAERIAAAKAAGEQLTFLPDEPQAGDAGRTPRGKGKATSQMRDWLASKGWRLPEDVLGEMAGLATSEDAFVAAMARTEQVLAWSEMGARDVTEFVDKEGKLASRPLNTAPTTSQRLETFKFVFTAQLRAAEALAPYGLAKVTPDAAPQQAVHVNVFGGSAAPASGPDQARDVTPKARRLAPPPMPSQVQQNQGLSAAPLRDADREARTE
ncbi:MAG: hypothetical protein DI533_04630 [Cereibacter sphaeroides]|uniref:Uncharacterized protein n=1 Tax=Cereibacter sphaeroides TaxID=1063 RepID=A0A2W5SA69_CERSP|nr:MAG: hypothetical protein DI533_04630 [Cereibacter sphaeroides]